MFKTKSIILFASILLVILTSGCSVLDKGTLGSFRLYKSPVGHGYKVEKQIIDNKEVYVERFELRDGDCFAEATNDCITDRERSEISESIHSNLEGQEVWYGWDVKFPEDFKDVSPTQLTVGQFYHYSPGVSAPSWMFKYMRGKLWLFREVPPYYSDNNLSFILTDSGELPLGKWHRVEVNVKWSQNSDGFFKVWVNGKKKVDYKGKTARDSHPYLKYGLYRYQVSLYKSLYGVDKMPTQIIYYKNVSRTSVREDLIKSNRVNPKGVN